MAVFPQAGVNCDVVLGDLGLLTVPGTTRRFDTVPVAPAIRSGDPTYRDFSLSQFWVQNGWQHGRGALDYEDPFAFFDSSGVDTRIRGALLLAPLQNQTLKTGSVSVGNAPLVFRLSTTSANLFMGTGAAGRDMYQWNNGTGLWNAETAGLTADPTDMTDFLGDIWVAQGQGNVVRRKNAGTWSDSWSGAVFFAAGANQVLYWSYNTNELYWATANPNTAANRIGPVYVGDTNTQIRSLCLWDGRLYIGKDDGLYVLQDGRISQLLDVSYARDSNNFTRMCVWQGALYFPILHGLFRLVAGVSLQAVGPDLGAKGAVELGLGPDEIRTYKSLASDHVGRIVGLMPTDNFLYAVLDAGTDGTTNKKSSLLAYNGAGWHTIADGAATNTRMRAGMFTGQLATSGQFLNPRLWYGYGTDCYNVILPFGTDDPYDYSSQTYVASGTLDTPWFDAGLKEVFKTFISCKVYSQGLTSTETLTVAYEPDDLGTRQSMVGPGNSPATQTATFSPYQTLFFPPNTVARKIRLRFTLARGATTTLTPRIKAVVSQFLVRPDTRYASQLTARTGKNMKNPYTGVADKTDPAEWLQLLSRLRDRRERLLFDDGQGEPGAANGAAVNLVLNPSFRIDTNADGTADNWNAIGASTPALNMIQKIYGLQSQAFNYLFDAVTYGIETDTITTVVGTRYTASVYVRSREIDGDPVTLELRDQAAGSVIASMRYVPLTTAQSNAGVTNDWMRLEATGVATSTSTRVRITRNAADNTSTVNGVFFVCAAQLEVLADSRFLNAGLKASSYGDGDQPRCQWTGAPYSSTTTRARYRTVLISNINAVEVKKPSIPDRLRGVGPESRVTLTVIEPQ